MGPFEMVVAIVFICIIGGVLSSYFKSREQRRDANASSHREADELRELIDSLEDRIRVLERIVTDTSGREDLLRQFRELER